MTREPANMPSRCAIQGPGSVAARLLDEASNHYVYFAPLILVAAPAATALF